MKPKGAMRATSAIVALLLCATPGAAVEEAIEKGDAAGPPTPTSRVVSLLQGLSKEIAEEGKKEEDLYFAFVCWGDKVISEKTKSNAAAQARIDELEAYLDDVKSGRVEFTTEREDLEAQIAELNAKIKLLVDTRASEKKDYEAAQAEMKEAIAALEKALEVMREGTAFTQRGSLLSIRAELGESSEQHAADSTALDHAVALATRYLSKGDPSSSSGCSSVRSRRPIGRSSTAKPRSRPSTTRGRGRSSSCWSSCSRSSRMPRPKGRRRRTRPCRSSRNSTTRLTSS